MHRRFAAVVGLLAAASVLVACAAGVPTASSPTPVPSTTRPSPSASAEPGQLVLTLDGLTYVDGEKTTQAGFEDAAGLLSLLEGAIGSIPSPAPIESMPGYDMSMVSYDWDGMRVLTDESGTGPASVAVTAPTVAGIPVVTGEGIAVGSNKTEVVQAQGWDTGDDDLGGATEFMGLGRREAPGTISLSRPGEVGIDFVLVLLDGGVVTEIQAPSNDYGDI